MFQSHRSRFSRQLGAAALAGLLSGAAIAAAPLPATPEAWRAAAQADIESAVRITRENHPGMLDPHNPAFGANLEAARRHGLALADKVVDASGYTAAILGFNVRIKDGHAGMFPRLDKSSVLPMRWPGFVTVWRGDGLYVHSAQPGQPAVGSRLRSCDGRPAERMIREDVFGFEGRVDEAGQWWSKARGVFLDGHNPFVALPRRCVFEAAGSASEHVLTWRALDAEAERWLAASGNAGDAGPVGVTEPRKNLFWVSMPTFQPNEAERAAYRKMAADITEQRARWLALDAVVIDLRKNQGGSSSWSQRFAEALWGKARVTAASAAADAAVEVWWRASPDNTRYVAGMAEQIAKEGNPEGGARVGRHAAGMREALAQGQPFYVQKSGPAAPAALEADGPPFTGPVYVVVPGNCASACLDALDVFTRFPNTTLVGAPSSADSTYMEVRHVDVASGRATVIVPNKLYVNRERANGEIYKPRIEVRDIAWTTSTLLKAIEADLARRRAGARTGGE